MPAIVRNARGSVAAKNTAKPGQFGCYAARGGNGI